MFLILYRILCKITCSSKLLNALLNLIFILVLLGCNPIRSFFTVSNSSTLTSIRSALWLAFLSTFLDLTYTIHSVIIILLIVLLDLDDFLNLLILNNGLSYFYEIIICIIVELK